MSEGADILVVGAGVVGIAIARALAAKRLEVYLIERNLLAGQEISSRNSGVIHSGIYYAPGSRKACLCVRGRGLLYDYCAERGIAHQRVGKIVVAQEAQVQSLHELHDRGLRNGVADLAWMTAEEVRRLEPVVRCAAGLLSPSTGIVDVHDLMIALHGGLEAGGGNVVFDAELIAATSHRDGIVATVRSGANVTEIACRWFINCAGLNALDLLRRIAGYPANLLRPTHYAKGNYFVLHGASPFRRLIYPMPNEAGLGIHATLDLGGTTRFGPDVEWIDAPDYEVHPDRAGNFYTAIREYWPGIPAGSLQPGYAGIRPKLMGENAGTADFEIEGPELHNVPGLINLLGIESPGLTASLALAEEVCDRVLSPAATSGAG